MQEVTVSTPQGQGERVARLALAQGIGEATLIPTRVFRDGETKEGEEVRVEVSAPESTQFIEAVMSADFFDPREYSIVSDEVVAIISQEPPERVTRPIKLSATTILQDLWLQNHLTTAYIARAAVSTLLVAYGLLSADMTIYIVALLFTPFMTQVMAVGFGGWMGDWRLARQGLTVLVVSTVIAIVAGVIVAAVMGGPLSYDEFGTLQSNFAISLLVGIVAGLDTADEAGRRELVAVAGAAQFASFPVWFGIALVLGFPDAETTVWRIVTFFVNIVTILVVTVAVYVALRYRRETIRRYATTTRADA
ncbi:MAG: DUF389 domain-containing protein [Candidatus Promineofilum sp.]|nr:DUF389 domain-containing protein [Promineifilum sp.]